MAKIVIDDPEVTALIERAANALTSGDAAKLVAIAVRRLVNDTAPVQPLFGAHPGSVKIRPGVDLIKPLTDLQSDAESGQEIRR